jgi:4-hydroxybenzoate polyprenyltransferase
MDTSGPLLPARRRLTWYRALGFGLATVLALLVTAVIVYSLVMLAMWILLAIAMNNSGSNK